MPARVDRVFVGWERPLPFAAADHLLAATGLTLSARKGSELDLSEVVACVPGGRLGRLLLGVLIERCEERGWTLVPPRFVTMGALPGVLFPPRSRPGLPVERLLAWQAALRSLDEADRKRLAADEPGSGLWTPAAEMLDSSSREIFGHNLDFHAILEKVRNSPDTDASDRWSAAARAADSYLERLAAAGCSDEPQGVQASMRAGAGTSARHVYLIGIAEVAGLARAALDATPVPVTALISAPSEASGFFDPLGCVLASEWSRRPVPIASDSVHVVPAAGDQAELAMAILAQESPVLDPADIALGVPDVEVAPGLKAKANRMGIKLREAAGRAAGLSAPGSLLAALADWVTTSTFDAWATLLRHPDLERRLASVIQGAEGGVERWLADLDRFSAERLPSTVTGATAIPDGPPILADLIRETGRYFDSLSGHPRPVRAWTDAVLAVLRDIYTDDLEQDEETIEALGIIRDACEDLARGAEALAIGPVDAPAVLKCIGRMVARVQLTPAGEQNAIDMLGWLELAWDPARVVVVTGMNAGMVPRSERPDPLLTPSARKLVGLPDRADTYARDAYLATVLINSRPTVHFISGQRSRSGDVLAPSRLLLACEPQDIAARVKKLTEHAGPPALTVTHTEPARVSSGFRAAPCPPASIPTSLAVREFGEYLRSPYGFYLKSLVRVEEAQDRVHELDALRFGTLIHDTLQRFSHADEAKSTSEDRIRRCVEGLLDEVVASIVGSRTPAAVRVQVEQARKRLVAWAEVQAEWAESGWRIKHTEWQPASGCTIAVDGKPFGVRGRIDRIDVRGDEFAIIDYKVSESRKFIRARHVRGGRWIDLQLPLYRTLAKPVTLASRPTLAICHIPAKPGDTEFEVAEWSEAELATADAAAECVVRSVRQGKFSDLGDTPPSEGILGAIAGEGLIGALETDDE